MTKRNGSSAIAVAGAAWLLFNAGAVTLLQPFDRPFGNVISSDALRIFAAERLVLQDETGEEARSLRYRLMSPEHPESDREYPLVLFLHGSGQRGRDNRRQLRGLPEQMAEAGWRAQYPCYFVAPQCPDGESWREQMALLEELIDRLRRTRPIDERRIYLTGLSMGGFGSWELASRRPERFAALVPICGGGDPTQAGRLVDLPVWAVHGDADEVVSVGQSRRMIEAIRQVGGRPRYTELEGVGHDSWTQTYAAPGGVVPWMFRQRNEHSSEASADPRE